MLRDHLHVWSAICCYMVQFYSKYYYIWRFQCLGRLTVLFLELCAFFSKAAWGVRIARCAKCEEIVL